MGSHDFSTFVQVIDPTVAYREATDQALMEYGHDAYNGTISTTNGFRIEVPADRAITMEAAHKLADERLDNYNKWEECGAIAIRASEDTDVRYVDLSVDVTDAPSGESWQDKPKIIPLVEAKLKLTSGESIRSIDVVAAKSIGQWPNVTYEGGATAKIKSAVEATQGKAITRYFIVPSNMPIQITNWDEGHPTQAAARAALARHVTRSTEKGRPTLNEAWDIVGLTKRENGDPVVRGTRTVTKVTYPVKVTIAKIKTGGHIGWLFFGWAAS